MFNQFNDSRSNVIIQNAKKTMTNVQNANAVFCTNNTW